ncbi:sensor domain-containing diguanylate cyclase [Salinibius halmophilus]|uniref:sensor domain-containing diguanylate cyclase n=1 Tax=Salinibius halmophilus TaxID=1853216 RepID=UPI000E669A27|nr:GGDEF domain-containing protein [Salinibius halmophilus]
MKWWLALLVMLFSYQAAACTDYNLELSCLNEPQLLQQDWQTSIYFPDTDRWQPIGLRNLPHLWRDDEQVPNHGKVRYQKLFVGDGFVDGLVLSVGQPYSAIKVLIARSSGEQVVAFNGGPLFKGAGRPAPPVIALPRIYAGDKLVLEVSNGAYPFGWAKNVEIGPSVSLITQQFSIITLHILLIGILLATVGYNLGIWLPRRSAIAPLLLAAGSLVFALRIASMGGVIAAFLPDISVANLWRLNWGTAYANFLIWPIYFNLVYVKLYPRPVLLTIQLMIAAVLALTLLSSPLVFVPLGQLFSWMLLVIVAVYLWLLLYRIFKERELLTIKFAALVFIILGVLSDIVLYLMGVAVAVDGSTVGVTLFVLSQSYVLSKSYSDSLLREAKLATQLKSLNQSLEKQVNRRTEELKQANEELQTIARTDKLTGLPNRRAFDEYIAHALARYRRNHSAFAIALVDADHFKKVNDGYGHDVGDIVLMEIAGCLRSAIRETDFACRLGGEEFAVLMTDVSSEQAAAVSERLRRKVEKFSFSNSDKQLRVTVSVGLALVQYDDSIERIFIRADKALYRAKTSGRNRLCINLD